jgi:hypothetical protein
MGKSITDEELDVLFQKLGLELARHTDDSDELISSIFGSGCEVFLEAFCAVGCLSLPDFVTGPAFLRNDALDASGFLARSAQRTCP